MAKLYKAIDSLDDVMSCFFINDKGVFITSSSGVDSEDIDDHKDWDAPIFYYHHISEFEKRAIDPVLIAEW